MRQKIKIKIVTDDRTVRNIYVSGFSCESILINAYILVTCLLFKIFSKNLFFRNFIFQKVLLLLYKL